MCFKCMTRIVYLLNSMEWSLRYVSIVRTHYRMYTYSFAKAGIFTLMSIRSNISIRVELSTLSAGTL